MGARSSLSSTSKIGFPVSYGTSKAAIVISPSNAVYSTRALNINEITAIPKQTSALEVDHRERQIVNGIGWKFQVELALIGQATTGPVVMNWAIIAPKGKAGVPTVTDFFRGRGDGRTNDFSIVSASTSLNNNKINDDLYDIITHRKLTLNPSTNTTNVKYEGHPTQATIDEWIPLGRQLRYDTNQNCISPVYFVYWFDLMLQSASTAARASTITMQKNVALHFKESL